MLPARLAKYGSLVDVLIDELLRDAQLDGAAGEHAPAPALPLDVDGSTVRLRAHQRDDAEAEQ
jgi:hypothetical protein